MAALDRRNPAGVQEEQTIEDLMRLRAEIDQELSHRLTQQLCLMFADVAGSTAFYRKHGDMQGRLFVQRHHDILFPLVEQWEGRVIKTIGDAVMASFEKPQMAIDCAIAIQQKLWDPNQRVNDEDMLRTKISLHYGNALVEPNDINGDLVNFSAQLNEAAEPDQILLSQAVYDQVKNREDLTILPLEPLLRKESAERIPLYEVLWKQTREEVVVFRDFQGAYQVCFYCGLKEHQACLCPSKHLEGKARGINALGHLPISEILQLFQRENLNIRSPEDPENPRIFEGFYEISFPYQLHFLKKVWLATTEDWDEMERRSLAKSNRLVGTPLWRGLDCLRVGRYDEAKTLFFSAADKDPRDYKPYIALGFWEVEKENPSRALLHWQKGLSLAQNALQESYVYLLMYRLYAINGKIELARQELHRALVKDPHLHEAKYRQIALLTREGKEEEVLARLQKMIQEEPRVYLKVVLDPDFASLRPVLSPFLQNLVQEARTEALDQLAKVTEELNRLREWYPWPEATLIEVEGALNRIRNHIKNNSYLGYRSATHEGHALQIYMRKLLLRRKEQLQQEFKTTLSSLHDQLSDLSPRIRESKVEKMQVELSRLQTLTGATTPSQFWRAWKNLQKLKATLQDLQTAQRQILSEKLRQGGYLLLQLGLWGLASGVVVDALLLSVFGYRLYFSSTFRPSEGQVLTYLKFGALGGSLVGSVVGWFLRKCRIF